METLQVWKTIAMFLKGSTFNRTNLEWKLVIISAISDFKISGSFLLIAPIWNGNTPSYYSSIMQGKHQLLLIAPIWNGNVVFDSPMFNLATINIF